MRSRRHKEADRAIADCRLRIDRRALTFRLMTSAATREVGRNRLCA
jgi:hypothetical protein